MNVDRMALARVPERCPCAREVTTGLPAAFLYERPVGQLEMEALEISNVKFGFPTKGRSHGNQSSLGFSPLAVFTEKPLSEAVPCGEAWHIICLSGLSTLLYFLH